MTPCYGVFTMCKHALPSGPSPMNRYPNAIAARLDDDSYLFFQTLRSMTENGSWGEVLRALAEDEQIRRRAVEMLDDRGGSASRRPFSVAWDD